MIYTFIDNMGFTVWSRKKPTSDHPLALPKKHFFRFKIKWAGDFCGCDSTSSLHSYFFEIGNAIDWLMDEP